MHQRTTQHSYALAIHPRTLRILDEAGLSDGLIGAGRKLTKVAYYEGRERRAEIDYSALASKHPYLLVLRQSLLERAAEEALRQQKLKVLWGHRLQSLNVDGAHAPGGGGEARPGRDRLPRRAKRVGRRAKRDDPTGLCDRRRRVRLGRAADGRHRDGRSMARARSSPSTRSRRRGSFPREVRVILDPDLTSVYWPLEEGRCRWGFQIRDASDTTASMERLEQLIAARAPWCTARPTQIYWSTLAPVRAAPDAELRQGRRLARRGRRAPGGSGRRAQHERGAGRSARAGRAHRADPRARGGAVAPPGVRDRDARGVAMAPRRRCRTALRALPGADPWVRQTGARILACMPASGDDLEPLLRQIGLTAAP